MTTDLVFDKNHHSGTHLLAFFDLPPTASVNAVITNLEDAAGYQGDWDGDDWWGVTGTFKGERFTVYTHKSGTLKIGGHGPELDVAGLTAVLRTMV